MTSVQKIIILETDYFNSQKEVSAYYLLMKIHKSSSFIPSNLIVWINGNNRSVCTNPISDWALLRLQLLLHLRGPFHISSSMDDYYLCSVPVEQLAGKLGLSYEF
jgi:hypothetical protein